MWCIEAALYSWRESTRYNIKEILHVHIQNCQQVYHEELLGTLFYTLFAILNRSSALLYSYQMLTKNYLYVQNQTYNNQWNCPSQSSSPSPWSLKHNRCQVVHFLKFLVFKTFYCFPQGRQFTKDPYSLDFLFSHQFAMLVWNSNKRKLKHWKHIRKQLVCKPSCLVTG